MLKTGSAGVWQSFFQDIPVMALNRASAAGMLLKTKVQRSGGQ